MLTKWLNSHFRYGHQQIFEKKKIIKRNHSVGNEIISTLKTVKKGLATHIRGKNQIGVIWARKDINYHTERFILLLTCIGYHRYFVVDIICKEFILEPIRKFTRTKGRHLRFPITNVREDIGNVLKNVLINKKGKSKPMQFIVM